MYRSGAPRCDSEETSFLRVLELDDLLRVGSGCGRGSLRTPLGRDSFPAHAALPLSLFLAGTRYSHFLHHDALLHYRQGLTGPKHPLPEICGSWNRPSFCTPVLQHSISDYWLTHEWEALHSESTISDFAYFSGLDMVKDDICCETLSPSLPQWWLIAQIYDIPFGLTPPYLSKVWTILYFELLTHTVWKHYLNSRNE